MKALKLTPKERELFEHLKQTPGGYLRQHIKPTNSICFRLLDGNHNPLYNYRYGLVIQLVDKNVLEVDGHNYVLKATSESNEFKGLGLVNNLSHA